MASQAIGWIPTKVIRSKPVAASKLWSWRLSTRAAWGLSHGLLALNSIRSLTASPKRSCSNRWASFEWWALQKDVLLWKPSNVETSIYFRDDRIILFWQTDTKYALHTCILDSIAAIPGHTRIQVHVNPRSDMRARGCALASATFSTTTLLSVQYLVIKLAKLPSDLSCNTVLFAKLRFHPLLISRCQQPELKPKDNDLKGRAKIDKLVVCCARGPFTVFATYAASAQAGLRWNKSSWKFLKFCNSWGKPWFD